MKKFLTLLVLFFILFIPVHSQTITSFATNIPYPFGQIFNPTEDTMYVSGQGSAAIYRVVGGTVSTFVSVSNGGYALVRNHANTALYTGGKTRMDKIDIATANKTTIVSSGFNSPWGLTITQADRYLYVADGRNHAVKRIDLNDNTVSVILDSTAEHPLSMPYAVLLNSDETELYIANAAMSNILKVTIPGGIVSEVVSNSTAPIFSFPTGLAFDATQSNLYVASYFGDIYKVSMSDHSVSYVVNHSVTSTLGTCNNLTIDSHDNLYVSNLMGQTVYKITTAPTGVWDNQPQISRVYSLDQNYPNPFNPSTTIQYNVPVQSHVRVTVYNILGEEVVTLVNQVQNAGTQSVRFDAGNLPSGMYTYRLQAGDFSTTKKMFLVK